MIRSVGLAFISRCKNIHKNLINTKLNRLWLFAKWIGFSMENLISQVKMNFGMLKWIAEIDWTNGFDGLESILKSMQSILGLEMDC